MDSSEVVVTTENEIDASTVADDPALDPDFSFSSSSMTNFLLLAVAVLLILIFVFRRGNSK